MFLIDNSDVTLVSPCKDVLKSRTVAVKMKHVGLAAMVSNAEEKQKQRSLDLRMHNSPYRAPDASFN